MRDQYTDYYVRLVGAAESEFLLQNQIHWYRLLQAENDNLRGVVDWSSESDQAERVLRLVGILGGLALLVLGASWLVDAAITMARAFGVNELVIGLTIVAAGTSLPEVATSVMASIKGERDIAVGNIVGSNIFNILSVLGLAALVAPEGVNVAPAALRFDMPIMIAATFACLPIFFTGYNIARWEGLLFLAYYLVYTLFLIGAAAGHPQLASFSVGMFTFVVPLTLVTLSVTVWRQWRRPSAGV